MYKQYKLTLLHVISKAHVIIKHTFSISYQVNKSGLYM